MAIHELLQEINHQQLRDNSVSTKKMIMKKNLNIQALRGVCAIMVFLSHSMHVYNCEIVHTLDRTPLRLLYAGEVAVSIFFVLSGFFYYNKSSGFSLRQYINTIIKKTKRIYPPPISFF